MENNAHNAENHMPTSKSSKVVVRQLPKNVDWTDFEKCLGEFGEVVQCDHAGNAESPSAIVTYKGSDQAQTAVEKLNAKGYKEHTLKATLAVERFGASGGGVPRVPRRTGRPLSDNDIGGYGGGAVRPPASEMPLRMVVNAKCVGAIIGQGGANIRQITKDSKARCVVDVSRGLRDSAGNMEKVINIYGLPENASKACIKILEIAQREMQNDESTAVVSSKNSTSDIELKLRAHNNLVGRLIGKAGGTIRKIMEETGCSIFVSNIGELSAFNMERTITIRGSSYEKLSQAEQRISQKLRQCFENDVTNAPHTLYGGIHPLMAAPTYGDFGAYHSSSVSVVPGGGGAYGMASSAQSQAAVAGGGPLPLMSMSPTAAQQHVAAGGAGGGQTEVVHVWVPSNIVGALIGTKGSHIRNVMRLTGAHIRIETPPPSAVNGRDETAGTTVDDHSTVDHQAGGDHKRRGDRHNAATAVASDDSERRVTITGTDQQQYKAQFWIFQRVCEQGYHFFDEVRLCTEIQVPSKMVGRIIGKGGQNVRELQRVTGAQVKIPEDVAHDSPEDTVVRIVGNFNAAQAVQSRIRQLMHVMHNRVSGNQ